MATAREVRAAVRAQLAEQLHARQDAALAVAAAWGKVEKARDRLTAAEREASAAIMAATDCVPPAELSVLAGVSVADLRRLTRGAKPDAPNSSAPAAASITSNGAPVEPVAAH